MQAESLESASKELQSGVWNDTFVAKKKQQILPRLADTASGEDLLRSEKAQWKAIAGQIREVREKFSPKTPLGKRRTGFAEAPAHDEAAIEEALVEREPVTIVVSEKGWIRALRGQVADLSNLTFKADDGLRVAFFAETTSKLLVFATNGR